uniref:Uncharacterized protein n=1 Tax=Paenibacillus polymyxa TaxID=1406 RepID=A0AAE9Q0C5_PAEPO
MEWGSSEFGRRIYGNKGYVLYEFPLDELYQNNLTKTDLFIIGEHAHSRYLSEDAYEMSTEPKELYVVPDAGLAIESL